MLTFCTIVGEGDQAQARVLAASIKQQHPGCKLVASSRESAEIPSGWDSLHMDDDEISVAALIRECLDGTEGDPVVYADPAVCLYAPLHALFETDPKRVAVCRRVGELPDDDLRPNDHDLLRMGGISPALVVARDGAASRELLAWWAARVDPEVPDGRLLELAAGRPGWLTVIEDRGCGVSAWNLHERALSQEGDRVLVDEVPLRYLEFTGFRADRPFWLSEDADRVRVVEDPILAELCGTYAEQLRGEGWEPRRHGLDEMTMLGNGQTIDPYVRMLWTEAEEDGERFGDPRRAASADAFVEWMRERVDLEGAAGINRYLDAAYRGRPDLQAAFPDLAGGDAHALLEWSLVNGHRELDARLLPAGSGGAGSAAERLGVNVIGYLGETLGLGEAARMYVEGLSAANIPVDTTAVTPDLPAPGQTRTIDRAGSGAYADRASGGEPSFNLACVNADHLAALVDRFGAEILGGRPTIGQWGWETDVIPPSWEVAFDLVDEVWVYSRFVAENLGRLLPMPVVVVPPPVVVPDVRNVAPPAFARSDRFTFLFMLDFFSTERRKNALGLVAAFTRAFRPEDGPRLLIKSINAGFRKQAHDELRARAAGHSHVEIVDAFVSSQEKAALLAAADCYVSLHRSEGFGLPLAESMVLGTPVIATGFSGNLDFMTPTNSWLVDYRPTKVGPGSEVYPDMGNWAEPDVDHAAEQMRRVFSQPEESRRRAERAKRELAQWYAPEVVGRIARARLEHLVQGRARLMRGTGAARSLDRVTEQLGFDLRTGEGAGKGISGIVRKASLRAMLPFTYHERELDRALFDALRDLSAEVEGLRRRH